MRMRLSFGLLKMCIFLNITGREIVCDGSHGDGGGVCLRACTSMCVLMKGHIEGERVKREAQ